MTRYRLGLIVLVAFGLLAALTIVMLGSATSMAPAAPAAERFGEEYVPPPSPVATEHSILSTPYSVPSAAPTTVVRQVYVAPKVKPRAAVLPSPTATLPVPSPPLLRAAMPEVASASRLVPAASGARVVVTCLDIQPAHITPGYCATSRIR